MGLVASDTKVVTEDVRATDDPGTVRENERVEPFENKLSDKTEQIRAIRDLLLKASIDVVASSNDPVKNLLSESLLNALTQHIIGDLNLSLKQSIAKYQQILTAHGVSPNTTVFAQFPLLTMLPATNGGLAYSSYQPGPLHINSNLLRGPMLGQNFRGLVSLL